VQYTSGPCALRAMRVLQQTVDYYASTHRIYREYCGSLPVASTDPSALRFGFRCHSAAQSAVNTLLTAAQGFNGSAGTLEPIATGCHPTAPKLPQCGAAARGLRPCRSAVVPLYSRAVALCAYAGTSSMRCAKSTRGRPSADCLQAFRQHTSVAVVSQCTVWAEPKRKLFHAFAVCSVRCLSSAERDCARRRSERGGLGPAADDRRYTHAPALWAQRAHAVVGSGHRQATRNSSGTGHAVYCRVSDCAVVTYTAAQWRASDTGYAPQSLSAANEWHTLMVEPTGGSRLVD
jgi:hypothetical protein